MFGKLLKSVTSLPMRLVNVPLKVADKGIKAIGVPEAAILSKPLDAAADATDEAIEKTFEED